MSNLLCWKVNSSSEFFLVKTASMSSDFNACFSTRAFKKVARISYRWGASILPKLQRLLYKLHHKKNSNNKIPLKQILSRNLSGENKFKSNINKIVVIIIFQSSIILIYQSANIHKYIHDHKSWHSISSFSLEYNTNNLHNQ